MIHDPLTPGSEESVVVRAGQILFRRRTLAFVVFATVMASAISFAVYLPDLYQASALVLVERQVSEAVVRPSASGELESRLQIIKQEILSRSRLTDLVERFNLYPNLRQRGGLEAVLDQSRRDIQVDLTGPEQVNGRTKTVAFRLSYTGEARETVADVTNAIAAFYVAQNDRMRSEEATRTAAFLKGQLIEAKKQLEHHEDNVRGFTSRHVGELPQQTGVNLATLTRLNDQLRLNGEQQLHILEQRERLLEGFLVEQSAAMTSSSTTPTFVGDPLELEKRFERLKDELQQAETRSTAKHPDVIRLKEQVAAVERELAEREAAQQRTAESTEKPPEPSRDLPPMRRRALENLDGELARMKKTEADVRTAIAAFERRLEGMPELQQEFMLLSRDHQASKDLYDSLLKRYDEAQMVESVEVDRQGERFRILEPAVPAEGPSAPNRARLLILGLLLAFAAAGATVLIAEQMDTSFHAVDDIRAFTNVPVLASIPRIGHASAAGYARVALGTASALAAIAMIAVLSAHLASGNEQLVRLLARAS
jgi:polysaccharide chain length determinant protein (PEP-CTERM system associated)